MAEYSLLNPAINNLLTHPTESERGVAILQQKRNLISSEEAVEMILEARQGHRGVAKDLRQATGDVVLVKAIVEELGLHFADLENDMSLTTDSTMIDLLSIDKMNKFTAVPVRDADGQSYLALANPGETSIIDFLKSVAGSPTRLLVSPASHIRARLAVAAASSATNSLTSALADTAQTQTSTTIRALPTNVGANPVVEWVTGTLATAVTEGASDIHFEYNDKRQLQIRFRVDGMLDLRQVGFRGRDNEIIGTIISRCPTMDPANLLEPQDGTFSFTAMERTIDVRVAMLPMEYGPGVVLRLLDSSKIRVKLEDMGFSPASLTIAREVTASAQGLILLSGPTGSGKTTTLYSLLREVDAVSRRILTVEDPIEYRLPNIGQVPINSNRGDKSLTFPRALRSILRMDPDVILVGEIRDGETARTAADAAITGHLVLSTVHASNALATYTRLIEMGVPSFMVSEAISLTVAQRLMRRLHDCARWVEPSEIDKAALQSRGLEIPERVREKVGCELCQHRGYRGRTAIIEMLQPNSEVRALVAKKSSAGDLREAALRGGFSPMINDAHRHVINGSTTISEMFRVLVAEDE